MNFNIDNVVPNMITEIKGTVSEHWGEVQGTANQFFANKKDRLSLLAELRITGEISEEKFLSRMKDEELILEAQLNAVAVISKAIAQKATNAAIEVLHNTVRAACRI